jgi:hypothetical protein
MAILDHQEPLRKTSQNISLPFGRGPRWLAAFLIMRFQTALFYSDPFNEIKSGFRRLGVFGLSGAKLPGYSCQRDYLYLIASSCQGSPEFESNGIDNSEA